MSVTNRVTVCSVSPVVQLSSYGSVDSNAAQVLQSPICQHFFVVCPRNLASTSATWHVALGTHTEEKIHVKHEKPPQVTDVPPQQKLLRPHSSSSKMRTIPRTQIVTPRSTLVMPARGALRPSFMFLLAVSLLCRFFFPLILQRAM